MSKNTLNTIQYYNITFLPILIFLFLPVTCGSFEFPPTSPLQDLLLCPNFPHFLHFLAVPVLSSLVPAFVSSGFLTLFFLGLLGGLLRCEGFIGGSPVLAHIVLPFIDKIILS
jgi:hypothetical protein